MRATSNIAASAFAIAMLYTSAAYATPNHGWYASVELGGNLTSVEGEHGGGMLGLHPPLGNNFDLDVGLSGFGIVGFELGPRIQIEGELGYRGASAADDTSVNQTSFMVNALVNFPVLDNLSIFGGLGVGADFIGRGAYEDQTAFAWQAIAGLNFALTDRIGLFVRYRYFDPSDSMIGYVRVEKDGYEDNIWVMDMSSQTASIGIKFGL